MVGSRPNREEFVGSHREDQFVNLERRRDREVNVNTTDTIRSHSRMGSHISNEEETRNLRLEVDHLHRKLHCKQRMTSPPSSGSESGEDSSYRPQPRTPHSESFSYKEERYHKQRSKSLTHRSLGNDAISRALRHISKSLFTRKIDRAKLPCRFAQPTFTIYNERTDPVEHVSHFNQKDGCSFKE